MTCTFLLLRLKLMFLLKNRLNRVTVLLVPFPINISVEMGSCNFLLKFIFHSLIKVFEAG